MVSMGTEMAPLYDTLVDDKGSVIRVSAWQ